MSSVALMIYGDDNSGRNALTEEKYKDLAIAFLSNGFKVESVLYNDESTDKSAVNFSGLMLFGLDKSLNK
jgi:hypothetical protein